MSQTPADRAALRDRIRRAVCEAEGFAWDSDMLEPDEYGEVADAVLAVLPQPAGRAAEPKLAAMDPVHILGIGADEAPAAPDLAVADNPTPLRWGLNDVLWGDDDSVTVLLSGPGGEPYWLELDPERAAVLHDDLAGPDETQPVPCTECGHPYAVHRDGDDPVTPGACTACPDDERHDYRPADGVQPAATPPPA